MHYITYSYSRFLFQDMLRIVAAKRRIFVYVFIKNKRYQKLSWKLWSTCVFQLHQTAARTRKQECFCISMFIFFIFLLIVGLGLSFIEYTTSRSLLPANTPERVPSVKCFRKRAQKKKGHRFRIHDYKF